jgi:hypothetical protein
MSHPFSPARIRFGGYGKDGDRVVWARFWTGGPGSPSVVVPVSDLSTGSIELWRKFGDHGFVLTPADKQAILKKVQPYPGKPLFSVVQSIGWHQGYVTPSKVFGAPSYTVERQFGGLDLAKYRSSGSLSHWQKNVLSLYMGNSRLMFAVLCALAGPVLEILGVGSFGVQLFGPSSIGKTIALIVGGSVWGCRVGASSHLGFLATWSTTPEGVETYGREHKDCFLPVDETRLAGNDRQLGNLVSKFIMRLAQGTTKNSLIRVGSGDWRLVYLGSSNLSLAEMFAAAGLDFDDAYRVRFPDIPADAGRGLGVFEDLHGSPDAADFANELRTRAITHFGTASEHFLEPLARDRRDRFDWLRSGLQRAVARYRDAYPVSSAADGRVADNFARVFALVYWPSTTASSAGAGRRYAGPSAAVSLRTNAGPPRAARSSTRSLLCARISLPTLFASVRCLIRRSPMTSSIGRLASFISIGTVRSNTYCQPRCWITCLEHSAPST